MTTFSVTVRTLLLAVLTGLIALVYTGCAGPAGAGPRTQALMDRNDSTKAQIATLEREMTALRQESATLEEEISQIYTRMDQEAAQVFLYRDHAYMEMPTKMLLNTVMGNINGIQGEGRNFRFTITSPKFQTRGDSLAFSANYTIQSEAGTCSGISNGSLASNAGTDLRVSGFQVSCRTGQTPLNVYLSSHIPPLKVPVKTGSVIRDTMGRGRGREQIKRNVYSVDTEVPVTLRFEDHRAILRVPSVTLTGKP